ncbi:MAG: hypothetical protein N2422_00320 [Rhodobacteraceae bacterium]|nr:hypothetical protein [Paracoccaceae bacterium]
MTTILILGSAPDAVEAAAFPRAAFDRIVAINNAWRIRPDWDDLIHPWDFPPDRLPQATGPAQCIVTEDAFVPAQNAFGGFVYAGATMAFTAGYWALHHYRPRVIAYFGCDMVYPATGRTHFYGTGEPDPLRPDITLRSLEAKSARLLALAARAGTAVVNLSPRPSRLLFPRASVAGLAVCRPHPLRDCAAEAALRREARLGYVVPSGRYWEDTARFDPRALDRLDRLWLGAIRPPGRVAA